MEYKKDYKKPYKNKTSASKVEYKPKRGNTDGSGLMVQGEGLKYKQKRGPLSKLMSEEEKQNAGIHELSYDFGCRITRLFQFLTDDTEYKEYVISKQIYRSGTSVGANVRESKHAQSDADFLSKATIALKESRESETWLHMLSDNGYLDQRMSESILHDCARINKILITITAKVKKRLNA